MLSLKKSVPIRILVVDDCSLIREALREILKPYEDIQIVGEAQDGEEAIEKVKELRPRLVLMDLFMPKKNGLQAIEEIMAYYPTPILVVTGASPVDGEIDLSFQALELGALDFIEKPQITRTPEDLLRKIRLLSKIPVIPHLKGKKKTVPPTTPSGRIPIPKGKKRDYKIVLIGASAGGPNSIMTILKEVPSTFPLPIVIVQHHPEGFSEGLASWLNQGLTLEVSLAREGVLPSPGMVYIAPAGQHLLFDGRRHMTFQKPSPQDLHSPSITKMMESGALAYEENTIGLLLTGMGDDGALGMKKIHEVKGYTLIEDESTCLIFGMPGRALELGAVLEKLPREKIGERLLELGR